MPAFKRVADRRIRPQLLGLKDQEEVPGKRWEDEKDYWRDWWASADVGLLGTITADGMIAALEQPVADVYTYEDTKTGDLIGVLRDYRDFTITTLALSRLLRLILTRQSGYGGNVLAEGGSAVDVDITNHTIRLLMTARSLGGIVTGFKPDDPYGFYTEGTSVLHAARPARPGDISDGIVASHQAQFPDAPPLTPEGFITVVPHLTRAYIARG